jgi:hypothetical protein
VDPRAYLLMKGTIIGMRAVLAVAVPVYRHEIVLLEADGEQYVNAGRRCDSRCPWLIVGVRQKVEEKTQVDRMAPRID